jgi:hypothetical protein
MQNVNVFRIVLALNSDCFLELHNVAVFFSGDVICFP